jgi:hypothetical protein
MEQVDLRTVDPQRFVTYRNDATHCFCHVRLDSGERVLVSGGKGEIKLLKLGFGGMVPLRTISRLSAAQIAQLFKPMLADASYPLLHPLDMMAMMIAGMPSIADLRTFLAADPEAQRAVVTAVAAGGKRRVDEWRQQQGKDRL